MYQDGGRPSVTTLGLAGGSAGTMQTLAQMRRLAREGARSPIVRGIVASVLDSARVLPHDLRGETDALFRYVRDAIRFVRDPVGVEYLQGAEETLRIGVGDCDDKSTLLASMLQSIGHDGVRFRVIGADPTRPHSFTHVYVVDRVNGLDIPLDTTYLENGLGWQHPAPSIVADFAA